MTRTSLLSLAAAGLTFAAGFSQAEVAPAPGAVAADRGEVAAIVHAGEETTLSSQMAGKVRRISVGLGDQFRSGARLIEFDCSEQQAQLQSAQAEYRGARETHLARLRLQALGAAGELEVTLAASAADKARSQVALRESQLAYCGVNAPFPGRVVRLRVKTAESVQAGQALIDLVNPASLKLQMFVPAAWASWLRPNLPLKVRFNDGPDARTVNARISKLNARVEGVSQQLEIEARFESGASGLLPGMVGTALFEQPGS